MPEFVLKNLDQKLSCGQLLMNRCCATAPDDMNMNLEKDPHLRQKNLYQMSYHMTLAEKDCDKLF